MIIPVFLSFVFIILGAFHFYWALGGQVGFAAALPTNESGEKVLNPKKIDSACVGGGLLAFGLFYLVRTNLFVIQFPDWLLLIGGWIVPIIFLLRALGDFKYVGFFKKVKTTEFGRMDTTFYAPLCLVIALLGIAIQL